MASRLPRRALLLLPLLTGLGAAQRYSPPPPPLTVDPCAVHPNAIAAAAADPKAKPPVCPPPPAAAVAPAAGKPAPAEQFPFPGESAPAAKPSTKEQFPFPGSDGGKPAAKTAAPAKSGSTADQFPYPGETSSSPDAVPEGDTPRYVPDAPAGSGKPISPDESSSSSSSSSSGGDASPAPAENAAAADDKDTAGLPTKGRRRLPKVSAQSTDERVAEDLDVAKFYTERGNYLAAYLRSKDATKAMPDDPEGHFLLAQAAEKLHKKDEAVAEYALYLKLDPVGERRATAQRALLALR